MVLEKLFEKLTLEDLNNYVDSGQEEHLQLDFKTVNRADFSHKDDKKNFAKALSGFLNSSGGLIVWGILAKKNADGIDGAQEFKEIPSIALFLSKLNELTSRAVSPASEAVKHRIISTSGDKGLAITLVSESESGPHMAKLGEDRYYKRSGDSFYRMEHYDLEDMFGRRKKPKLRLVTRILGQGSDPTIVFGIENYGRATAKAPYLAFNVTAPFRRGSFGLDGNGNDGLPKLKAGQKFKNRYGASTYFVIHPGTIHEVASVDLGINPRPANIPTGDIIIEYEILAEDTLPVRDSVNLGSVR